MRKEELCLPTSPHPHVETSLEQQPQKHHLATTSRPARSSLSPAPRGHGCRAPHRAQRKANSQPPKTWAPLLAAVFVTAKPGNHKNALRAAPDHTSMAHPLCGVLLNSKEGARADTCTVWADRGSPLSGEAKGHTQDDPTLTTLFKGQHLRDRKQRSGRRVRAIVGQVRWGWLSVREVTWHPAAGSDTNPHVTIRQKYTHMCQYPLVVPQ